MVLDHHNHEHKEYESDDNSSTPVASLLIVI